MRSKKILILLVALLCACNAEAQKLTVTGAVKGSWSGGVAGHYGTRYTFTINCVQLKGELVPDTLWLENKAFPLVAHSRFPDDNNLKCTRTKAGMILEIKAAISHDQYTGQNELSGTGKVQMRPPVKYKGAALLSYRYGGREQYFEIKKIITNLPPVNYP